MTLTFLPLLPLWIIALTGLMLLLLLAYGALVLREKAIPTRWIARLAVLRVLAIVLFLLLLLRPILNYTRSTPHKPPLLILLDTSQSMGQQDQPRLREALDKMTSTGLRDKLQSAFDLHYFAFDADARPVPADHLNALQTDGATKNLTRSLETAWDYRHLSPTNDANEPGRILLLSDGNHLAGPDSLADPVATARRLGLRIDTLAPRDLPPPAPRPRLAITAFQGPASILLGSEARFHVRLRAQGPIPPGPARLLLLCDGKPVVTRPITLDPKTPEQQIDLTHLPATAGLHQYELQLRPASGGPAFDAPAPRSFSVNVRDGAYQVLLLEDTWRWDFHFLHRILEQDPGFSLTAFLSRRPGAYLQLTEPNPQLRPDAFPRSRADLEPFDIILLGDVNPSAWPPDLAPAIHDMVVEQGKSLIVLAGPGLQRLAKVPALASLLPVDPGPSAGYTPGPVQLAPAPGASASPLFYTPEGSNFFQVFHDLPPMDQVYAPLRKRPAANILLQAPKLRNDAGSLIVMAEQTVGRGQVLYVGTDTLWKWQMMAPRDAQERTPYAVFWQQALRALAPRHAATAGESLWLQADRTHYQAGQAVHLTAQLDPARYDPRHARINLRITFPDGHTLPAAPRPHPTRAGVRVAEFTPGVPGTYTLSAQADIAGQNVASAVTRIQVDPPPSLATGQPNNTAALAHLARATGGTVVSLDDPQTWPAAPADAPHAAQTTASIDLWRSGLLLFLLVTALGVDWLLRLLHGFV